MVVVVVDGRTDSCSYAAEGVRLADVVADVDGLGVQVSAETAYWNSHPSRPSRLPSHRCCYCW